MRARAIRQMQKPGRVRTLPRKLLFRAAAAVVLASVLGGSALYMYMVSPVTYETGVGTRRIVALPDGSRISLDSDSEVRVRYTDAVRKIILEHGRARFDVAHDTTRPFTVTAGSEMVVAIGTSFNVEKIGSKVLVTLIQGRVVIKNSTGAKVETARQNPVALKAGEEFEVARDNNPVVKQADMKTATAWEAGQLIFKNVSLEEAAARENRYTKKAIAVDPSVATLRISGVFNAGDVSAFVNAVTNYFPVQATTTADDQILLQSKP
ncbi:FecR family protein [Rhizomicrobium electricum]|uniref:FecR family protein n=1 Tax=Rhizomicrobium electricum TaxID=480070 RepID=UPI00141FB9CD|nr:FecR domain-containing protein [Rhizomicrobium electricum]NIJ46680.1 transmembrane sensor [Rhizomicrobium electricum]